MGQIGQMKKVYQKFKNYDRFEELFVSGNRRAADHFSLECPRQKKHRGMQIA
jgi:hypothetical protein